MNRRIPIFCLTLIVTVLLIPGISVAEFMPYPHYKDYIEDPTGTPYNGTYSVQFELYDDLVAGSQQWSETRSIDFSSGYFDVILGQASPITYLDFDEIYWMQITVNGTDVQSPRVRYGYVPNMSGQTLSLGGGTIDATGGLTISGGQLNISGGGTWNSAKCLPTETKDDESPKTLVQKNDVINSDSRKQTAGPMSVDSGDAPTINAITIYKGPNTRDGVIQPLSPTQDGEWMTIINQSSVSITIKLMPTNPDRVIIPYTSQTFAVINGLWY